MFQSTRIFSILILLLTSSCFADCEVVDEIQSNEQLEIIKKRNSMIVSLESVLLSKDTDGLAIVERMLLSLHNSEERESEKWFSCRKEITIAWLLAIDLLNAGFDPLFDPDDVPQLNVSPPPEARLPSGIGPSAIKDDVLREQYMDKIRKNSEKAKYYRYQTKLRRFQEYCIRGLARHVHNQYSQSKSDVDELNQLIDAYAIEEGSRSELEELKIRTK